MWLKRHIGGLVQQLLQPDDQGRQRDDGQHRKGPTPGRRQLGPAQQEERGQGDRQQAAPQVVEQFPARQRRQGVGRTAAIGSGHTGQQPAQQLPVAAHPAITSAGIGLIGGRILFIQQHVGQQGRAQVAAFQQVMAENPVFRKALTQRALEGVDIVNTLADEGTFGEQVLVHIRDRTGIGVDAGLGAAQARVARAVGAGQAGSHPRLQDAMTGDDDTARGIELRPVQWVLHGRHELARAVARQFGIGIQGDHIPDIGQHRCRPHHQREAAAGVAAQERVQVAQLAALALVTHPDRVVRIPAPRPVKQVKAVTDRRRILEVEADNRRARQLQQGCVAYLGFRRRIAKVGEQPEMQVAVAIGQKAHLQRIAQARHAVGAAEHGGDHHQGAGLRRNAGREIHARQQGRPRQQHRKPVHQRHRQLAGADESRHPDPRQLPGRQTGATRDHQQCAGKNRACNADRTQVERQGRAPQQPQHRVPGRHPHLRGVFKLRQAGIDQVEADMRCAVSAPESGRRRVRQLHRLARHLAFGKRAAAGGFLDHMPIAVAAGEVHALINAGRILAQLVLDHAHGLDELAPVHRL